MAHEHIAGLEIHIHTPRWFVNAFCDPSYPSYALVPKLYVRLPLYPDIFPLCVCVSAHVLCVLKLAVKHAGCQMFVCVCECPGVY